MEIKIKSTRVIKEGTQAKSKQPYKWVSVIVDDGSEKGTEYTTFDAGVLNLGAGSIIDIGEPKIKEGKLSFKDFKVVSEVKAGEPAAPPGGGGYKRGTEGIEFEYRLKAKLQAIERASIEGQTVYNGVIQLLTHWPDVKSRPETVLLIDEVIVGGLQWAKKAVGTSGAPVEKKEAGAPGKEPPKPEVKGGPTPVELPKFKDGPALVNYALKNGWKIDRVKSSLGINNPTEIKDIEAAAKILFGLYIHFAEEPELPF